MLTNLIAGASNASFPTTVSCVITSTVSDKFANSYMQRSAANGYQVAGIEEIILGKE